MDISRLRRCERYQEENKLEIETVEHRMGKHKRRKKDEKQTELGGKEKGETNKGEKERKRMDRYSA